MTNDNYIESIRTIVDAHHTQYGKFLRKPENKPLLDFIEQYEYEKLKDNNLQTKIYLLCLARGVGQRYVEIFARVGHIKQHLWRKHLLHRGNVHNYILSHHSEDAQNDYC